MADKVKQEDYEFKREEKYLVWKREDIERFTNPSMKADIQRIGLVIESHRHAHGKKDNSYVVVNMDEPYAEIVWQLIEMGERFKDKLAKAEPLIRKDERERILKEIEQIFEPNKFLVHVGLWEYGRIIFDSSCKHCQWQALKEGD